MSSARVVAVSLRGLPTLTLGIIIVVFVGTSAVVALADPVLLLFFTVLLSLVSTFIVLPPILPVSAGRTMSVGDIPVTVTGPSPLDETRLQVAAIQIY